MKAGDSRAPDAWQQRRAAYSHDWLQNQLLQLLGSALDYCRGEFEEEGFAERLPGKLVVQWRSRCGQAAALAEDFEDSMTPRQYLARDPLVRFDSATRRWLGEVVHQCWLTRGDKRGLVKRIGEAERQADEAFAKLEQGLTKCWDQNRAGILPELESFDRRCRALSRAISRLPARAGRDD